VAAEAERKRKDALAQEEARIAREKAEAQRRQRRAVITSVFAGMLILAAGIATVFALRKSTEAAAAIKLADEKTRAATVSDSLAQAQTKVATVAEQQAALANEIAVMKTNEAKTAAGNAELKKKEAELASLQAVAALIDAARKDILQLRYDAAFSKMKNASGLGSIKDSVAFVLMEIAFFRQHSGQSNRAAEPFALAAKLLGKSGIVIKGDVDQALLMLDKNVPGMLNRRYFPEMVDMIGGTFQMGSDNSDDFEANPPHEVTVSKFKMAKTETPFWQYNLYLTSLSKDINDSKIIERPGWGWEGDNPVVNVSWYDAVRYANWLSGQQRPALNLTVDTLNGDFKPNWDANGYRLPTEAEWEYAARGATQRDTFVYSGSPKIEEVAWFGDNSGNRTHAVGARKINGSGLYDMSGNVWEWCWDWYGKYSADPATNPIGPDKGGYRVFRGGGWVSNARYCRVANRRNGTPGYRGNGLGFRLVRPF
jgi:formylglycine-generating enzyme required for sulfatase activity